MKRICLLSVVLLLTIPLFSQYLRIPGKYEVELAFDDDFNTFNGGLWQKMNNTTHGEGVNEEPQLYTSDNVYIEDGKLVLSSKKLFSSVPSGFTIRGDSCYPHPNNEPCYYNGHHCYTSGEVISVAKYHYGYYEIYAKIPAGKVFWPALWFHDDEYDSLNKLTWYNEIDILEGMRAPDSLECGLWLLLKDSIKSSQLGRKIYVDANYASDYHKFSVLWEKDSIFWYYDENEINKVSNNYGGIRISHPMSLYMNLAMFSSPGYMTISRIDTHLEMEKMYVDKAIGYCACAHKDEEITEISDVSNHHSLIRKSYSLNNTTTLSTGDTLDLYATDFVELKAGFSVPVGAVLSVKVKDFCN